MEPRDEHRPAATEPELSLGDIIDRAGRRIATGIALAGGIMGLAIYSQPGPPRYEAVAVGGQVVRVNTKNGSMITCDGAKCVMLHRSGQKIAPRPKAAALPKPAPTAPAAPASKTGG